MCPMCVSSTATLMAGVFSVGGLAAFVATTFVGRAAAPPPPAPTDTTSQENAMLEPRIVSREEWLTARTELLQKEKALTRAADALAAERRQLPMVRVEKPYVFDTPDGPRTLAELFDGRSQLIVYHFMLGPGWAEGCPSCSLLADHIDPLLVHLAHRDVTVVVVSRAPLPEIDRFKRRMGWQFTWVSSHGNDFNRDYHVSFTKDDVASGRGMYNFREQGFPAEEAPGTSVFYKDATGQVHHSYSSYARGGEPLMGVYHFLDLVPKGRNEDGLAFSMSWVRHHDRYDEAYRVDADRTYAQPPTLPAPESGSSDACCHPSARA
jgi:predicted dithiol-disulfide oxidoreductase (DUF899 family)